MADHFHPLKTSDSIKNVISVLLMLAGCLIIYSNSLNVPFTFDDRPFIVNDTSIHLSDLSVKNLINAACEGSPGHRPFSNISFAVNYYFNKLHPWGYHLVNILIHFFSGVFLFFLINKTIYLAQSGKPYQKDLSGVSRNASVNSYWVALSAVVLWLFHPLHTESVTYVCQRMTSLAGMFYVLSLLLYVQARLSSQLSDKVPSRQGMFFSASAAAGALAVLSKPNAATLPLMILFYEWYFFQDLQLGWPKRRFIWIAAVIGLLCVFSVIFLGRTPIDRIFSAYLRRDFTLLQRVLTEFRVVIFYIGMLVFPYYKRLNLDYGYPLSDGLTAPCTTIAAILAILGMILGVVVLSRKNPIAGFGILWFLVNLLIESSVIGLEIIFEHRTYLPSMFLIFSLVAVLFRYAPSQKVAAAVTCMAITFFACWTWQRNAVWQDELVLWKDCTVKSPEKVRPYYNLGCLWLQRNQPDRSIPYFYRALNLETGSPEIHYNLGCALAKTQSNKKAIAHLIKVLELDPDHADAHTNLANILSESGKADLALRHYQAAAEMKPGNADFQSNLGAAFFSEGLDDEALVCYQKAFQLEPENITILNRLGYVLFSQGHFDESMAFYQKVLNLSPDDEEAHGKIGDLMFEKADYKKAVKHYIKALEQNSEDAQSHYNLAIAYHKIGRPEQARKHFVMAKKINPHLHVPDSLTSSSHNE